MEESLDSNVALFPGKHESCIFSEELKRTSENNLTTDSNSEHSSLNLQFSPERFDNEDSEEEDYELYKVCSPLEVRSTQQDNSETKLNSSSKCKLDPKHKSLKIQNFEVEDSKLGGNETSFLSVDSETSYKSNISPLKYGTSSDIDDSTSNISEKESISTIETESENSEHVHEELESNTKKKAALLKKGKKHLENKVKDKVETSKSNKGSKIGKGISKAVSSNLLPDEVDTAPTRLRIKHFPPTSIAKDVIPENSQVTKDKIHKGSGKDCKIQNSGSSSINTSPVKRSLRSRSQDPTSSTSQNIKKLDSRNRRSSADTDKAAESLVQVESSVTRKKQAQTPDIKFKERIAVSVRSSPRKATRSTVLDSSQSAETRESSSTPKKQNIRSSNQTASESKAKGISSLNTSTSSTTRSNLTTTTSTKTRRTKI